MHRKTLHRSLYAGLAATVAVALTAGVGAMQASADGDDWQSVGKGMTGGASGIAAIGHARGDGDRFDALVVRDSKEPGENRLARVAHRGGEAPRVRPLDWEGGEPPVDLEAVDNVPGSHGEYAAVTSDGTGYRFRLAGDKAEQLGTFTLPAQRKDDNYENFALTRSGGDTIAVWADRGDDSTPSTLRAASFASDGAGGARFGHVETAEVRAPYPHRDVRHASDLKVTDSGDLLVSSASDPGDDGPFDSAVYVAGHVARGADGGGGVRLEAAADPEPLATFEGHKIEALECLPGGAGGATRAALASDDEKAGGALTVASSLCGGGGAAG